MCGISGIINKLDNPVSVEEIRKITDMVSHRGPDSDGFYFGNNFALGHRRLSVIDLSASGNQPMSFKDRYTITYNGEIYNYREIKEELRKSGYHFYSDSDTEVILAAYDQMGTKCIEQFNGMWSFALHDLQKNIIFCSRDRFGVKPFYYTETSDKFIFGSEIKQLLGYHLSNKVNLPILMDYLISGFDDHTNETFFKNINKLGQSCYLIYDLKKHTYFINRYYQIRIDKDLSKLNEQESVKVFRDILTDSIKLRLRSDVKVGTCLSGGLDSSSVATIASSIYKSGSAGRFISVTAKSTEKVSDESHYARLVSNHSDMEFNVVTPEFDDFRKSIDNLVNIQEEPFGSPSVFMQFKVFEKAKETGCTVMLDGQGGDETLLGYERYYPAYISSLHGVNKFKNFIASSQNSSLNPFDLLLYMIYFTSPYLRIRSLKSKFPFIKPDFFSLLNTDLLKESSKSYLDIIELQKLELMSTQLPHLLKYEDKNSMINSVESRLPFLDYRLVEASLSINDSFKIKNGWTKYLLRKSVEDILPSEITWRKDKLGFNAPESLWMFNYNNQIKDQIKKSQILLYISDPVHLIRNFDKLNLRSKWRLFNIAKWEEVFNVTI